MTMEMEKLWERIKKSVTEGATYAAEKTEELTKLGRAKLDILTVKRKISKAFTELGGIAYESLKEGKADEVMNSEAIAALIASIKALEEDLDARETAFEDMKKKTDEK